ncbi:MAG: class I SAM-dependent methyltransferase [Saprospiraceae bacterium]|nr:class I SAM-dependent methyltransferase [Saprospiraceae bacterium]
MRERSCYLCKSINTIDFFDLPNMPTQDGVMSETYVAARNVTKADTLLRYCLDCTYIANVTHDQSKITFDRYDFSLDHSPIFQQYVHELCNRLIKKYSLNGKTVLDIGCGDGTFLTTLCKTAKCQGIGIDPGFKNDNIALQDDLHVNFIRDYYGEKYRNLHFDFITCRHVINVLSDPIALLQAVRKNLTNSQETILYFEVPNATYTFKDGIIWNVVYEHRSWFTQSSLDYLFRRIGFDVCAINTCWNGEYLGIEAKFSNNTFPKSSAGKQTGQLHHEIQQFTKFFEETKLDFEHKIKRLRQAGGRIIAWGAGARAVTFFNLFDLIDLVPNIVDINVQRQGKFLPGSGQEIVNPEFILSYDPETVIITNPTYEIEIKQQVQNLGLSPDFWIL